MSHFLMIQALGLAPAGAIQPFTYVQIVAALAIGWAVFDYYPDGWTLLGVAMIAGGGLYVILRGRERLGR